MPTREQLTDAIMFLSIQDALSAYKKEVLMAEIKLTVPATLLINLGPPDARDPTDIITPLLKLALGTLVADIKEKYKGREKELQKVIDSVLDKYKKASLNGGVMNLIF